MGDIHEVPRPRIATGQLAQHIGQPVCFVGRVEKIHPSGKLVVLTDGLGKHTTVELSDPQVVEFHKCKAVVLGTSVCVPLPWEKLVCAKTRGGQVHLFSSPNLDEEISGVIEVVGRVTNQATIMCASYVQFREDKSSFDLELYNEALKIIHEFPEYFPFGTGRKT